MSQTLKNKLLGTNYFVNNDYLNRYCELIISNKNTKKEEYKTQRHHIIPRCYYRKENIKINNKKENIVNLTYKDHILAHYYLCLCAKDAILYKLEYAFFYMLNNKSYIKLYEDKEYEKLYTIIEEYKNNLYESFCKRQSQQLKNRKVNLKSIEKYKKTVSNKSKEEIDEINERRSESLKGKNIGPRPQYVCDKIKDSRKIKRIQISEKGRKEKRKKLSKPRSKEYKSSNK